MLALMGHAGTVLIEAALVLPILILVALGGVEFGFIINNYVALTHATRTGARQFATSRVWVAGNPGATPLTTTRDLIRASAANLVTANITVTAAVNGTACGSDALCRTALVPAGPSTRGLPSTVTATYPCNFLIQIVTIPNCTLTATVTERIE